MGGQYHRNNQLEISRQLSKSGEMISNPESAIEKALRISSELATMWTSSNVGNKEKLQKLVFPEGIIYDKKIGVFRTQRINSVFELIARLSGNCRGRKKGQTGKIPICPF